MITPARRRTLHEEITKQIIDLISDGIWKPGERIPGEVSLAEQFEVSRNSIRESIKALELVGLLQSTAGKGTFVSENALERIRLIEYNTHLDAIDPEKAIIELLETRMVVEPGLCWFAAIYGTKASIKKMEHIINLSLDAVDHNQYHFDLGMAFHEELYRASNNKTLIELFAGMKEKLMIARREVYLKVIKKEILVQELKEHLEILNLIKAGDGIQAANAMRDHLHVSVNRLKKLNQSKTRKK